MGYLFLITFAGSALFAGYLCWEKVLGKFMTQRLKYRALIIVMLVYLVPWVWLKEIYRWIIGLLWTKVVVAGAKGLVNIADIETEMNAYQTKEYLLSILVVSIWFTIGVIFLLIRIVRYLVRRSALHELAIKCEDKNLEQTLDCLNQTVHYRHKPEVVWTRADNETFTLGAIKPIVFLQKDYAEGDLYWILKHEMMHIVRMDLWVKLLLQFVCCLHWFNPLIYLLERKVKYLCETSCDEQVTKGCTEEECRTYMDLLDRNKSKERLKNPFGSALEGNCKAINERIILIKNRKSISGSEKAITIGILCLLIFLDSLTALAYPKVRHVKSDMISVAEDAAGGNNFWMHDYTEEGYDTPMADILYNEQFADDTGEIYPIDFAYEDSFCMEHDVVSGIVQIHMTTDDGGCVIETYEGTRCKECGIIWKGEFLYSIKKTLCPHEPLSE